ncbi:TioE family transcriptional regulator [Nocardia sp. NPDC058058]|uniref:TioE family transcriptional regulator n=1 Tax=Nocardia sp. NPDC058058 TaxID=3346317 RepID=UPI0036D8C58A
MRPIDLAREHGLSAQAIRNYDDAGVLPPTERTETGYRRYTPLHAQALRTFLALRSSHGHQRAMAIMRAINRGDSDSAYRLIDTTHLELRTERGTRTEVAKTLGGLSVTTPNPIPGPPLTVGELAHRIDVHPATLRTWEAQGMLRPERDRATGYRLYGPESVRDAEIARQLRRGDYPLGQVATFLDALREAGGADALRTFLDSWQDRLTARSRGLLCAAAQLDAYLTMLDQP